MKRLLILTGIVALLLFLPAKAGAQSSCAPINPNTGLCDVGNLCSGGTQCCVNDSDCNPAATPSPAGGTGSPQTAPSDIHTVSPYCSGNSGISTALGCIPTTQTGFFIYFFRLGVGIAGGIAFLLILYGGLKMMLSAGNPEQLNEGRELVTSAIAGLLMIIFSVFILRIIGVNILGLPGFS